MQLFLTKNNNFATLQNVLFIEMHACRKIISIESLSGYVKIMYSLKYITPYHSESGV